jgi:hypothetical protein
MPRSSNVKSKIFEKARKVSLFLGDTEILKGKNLNVCNLLSNDPAIYKKRNCRKKY